MPATKVEGLPARSGIVLPYGTSRSKCWSWFRENRRRHLLFRAGVFVVGLLSVLVGAVLWLWSALLSAPAAFLGLWLWSREFHWGHRLLRTFLRRASSLWSRVKAHPARWAAITTAGIGGPWAAYWAWGHYGLFGTG